MEKSSFFNSVNGDRRYKAQEFAEYFSSFIGNGIFPNPSTNLQITANNNMTISLKSGKAWINGYFYTNTSDLTLSLDFADGVLNRIDRVVLRLDYINREIKAYLKKGQFSSSPIAQTIQRDADVYELVLADIVINKGAVSITQANITDKRLDENLCGVVHGVVEQVDVTTLFNQYTEGFKLKEQGFEQQFNEWFNTVKNTLGEDIAGNLLNLIEQNSNKIGILSQEQDNLKTTVNNHTSELAQMMTLIDVTNVNNYVFNTGKNLPLTDTKVYTIYCDKPSTGNVTLKIDNNPAKPLYKKPTNRVNQSIGDRKIYSVWYSAYYDCFFIKASAEGDALAEHVLAGKRFSNENDIDIPGTIPIPDDYPNNPTAKGFDVYSNKVNANGKHNLFMQPPKGYYDGNTWVGVDSPSITAENIKQGVIVGNGVKITGTLTSLEWTNGVGATKLICQNDAEVMLPVSTSFVKIKETQIKKTGKYLVSIDFRGTTASLYFYIDLYVNGVYRTSLVSGMMNSSEFRTITRDVVLNANDYVQIYSKTEYSDFPLRNFRFYIDPIITAGSEWASNIL